MATSKAKGLVLTLDGAPNTPHTFPGVPGLFKADEPVPVGPDHEISLDLAKKLDADKGVPLKLVDLKGGE